MGRGGAGEAPSKPGETSTSQAAGASADLSATQYVVLAENQRKKRALAETKVKYSQLVEENKRLLADREELQRETYEVTEYLRKEILAKTEKIVELEARVAELNIMLSEETARISAESEAREQQLQEAFTAKENMHKAQMRDLEDEMDAIAEFKTRREEVEAEMVSLREENVDLGEQLASQHTEWERKFIEHSTKLKKEYEQKLEEIKKRYEEDIDERLDAGVKRILGQNRRMAEELKLHIEETDNLQSEVKILEGDRARLGREVQLKRELEEGYAKRSAKQAREIKEANAKIASLEHSLQQLVLDFDKQQTRLKETMTAQLREALGEGDALKRMVRLKNRELHNVRRLAQDVLMQRSDVESFLLSSLDLVRKELGHERLASGSDDIDVSKGIDIGELGWSDRERVLRLLFAKINNQAKAAYFSSLPAHSFEPAFVDRLHTEAGPAEVV